METNQITEAIVEAAYRVHRALGPGLLESVYEVVLAETLRTAGLEVERQKPVLIRFEGKTFEEGFRADLVVEREVIVEVKSVEQLARVHKKQVLTYLKLSELRLGLLIKFRRRIAQGKYCASRRRRNPGPQNPPLRVLRALRANIIVEDRVLQKTSWRREMRQRLSSLAPTERETRSKILTGRLTSLPHWKNAQRILLFAPLATEPDLDLLWTWKEDRTFVYPRVDGHDLALVPVTSKNELSLGRWSLREPDARPANTVQIGSIDLALIPGLAFARSGSRLGRGGGYYDRLLANAPPSVLQNWNRLRIPNRRRLTHRGA